MLVRPVNGMHSGSGLTQVRTPTQTTSCWPAFYRGAFDFSQAMCRRTALQSALCVLNALTLQRRFCASDNGSGGRTAYKTAGVVPAVSQSITASSMLRKASSPSRSEKKKIEQPMRCSITWSESVKPTPAAERVPADSGFAPAVQAAMSDRRMNPVSAIARMLHRRELYW